MSHLCSAWPLDTFIKKLSSEEGCREDEVYECWKEAQSLSEAFENLVTLLPGLCLLPNSSTPHRASFSFNSLIGWKHRRRTPCDIITVSPIRRHMSRPHGPHPRGNTLMTASVNNSLISACCTSGMLCFWHRCIQIPGLIAGRNTCCHFQLLIRLNCSLAGQLLWQDATLIIQLCWEPHKPTRGLVSSRRLIQ